LPPNCRPPGALPVVRCTSVQWSMARPGVPCRGSDADASIPAFFTGSPLGRIQPRGRPPAGRESPYRAAVLAKHARQPSQGRQLRLKPVPTAMVPLYAASREANVQPKPKGTHGGPTKADLAFSQWLMADSHNVDGRPTAKSTDSKSSNTPIHYPCSQKNARPIFVGNVFSAMPMPSRIIAGLLVSGDR